MAKTDTTHIEDDNTLKKFVIVQKILVVAILLISIFGLSAFVNGKYFLGIIEALIVVFFLILLIQVNVTKNIKQSLILIPILCGTFFIFLFSDGVVDFSGHLWSLLFPAVVMYLIGSQRGLFACVIYAAVTAVVYLIGLTADYTSAFIFRYFGAFVAMTLMSFYMETIRTKLQEGVFSKNKELTETVEQLKMKDLALKEIAQHYKTLFDSSSEAVLILRGNKIVNFNPVTLILFGCKKGELIKKTFQNLFAQSIDSNFKIEQKIIRANSEKIVFYGTFKKCYGENFHAEIALNKLDWSGEDTLLCNIRDITNQKNAEQALVHAKEKAENSEKMKGDFLAQMSHEIRTPINTILNYTSLLKMEFEDKLVGEIEGSFVSIQNAANRLLRTIDMILGISEIESGAYTARYEKIDLVNQVVIPVINEFMREALQKDILLNYKNELKDQIFIFADFYSVYQLAANLIHNSIKYTLEGSVTLSVLQKDDRTELIISDTGIGMAEQYLPHLFKKFTQEEEGYTRKFEGSGLGLALVKQYSDVNKAAISVKSKKGIGTTFTISFTTN